MEGLEIEEGKWSTILIKNKTKETNYTALLSEVKPQIKGNSPCSILYLHCYNFGIN